VIVSKYPFIDTAHFNYGEGDFAEPLIYADVKVNNNIVRFFTTHLQSVRFENYDYEALHNLKEPAGASVTQSRALAWKLKQAYKKRAMQADMLHQKIMESPYPAIVCGDFNDVPNSYTYFKVKGNLQDAFLKKGSGFGRTFRFISPTLRIDYILADKKFTVKQFNELRVNYSDHYPVVADLELNKK
jgi:endonuclease/exonuclease/phosphatase family metal-dependent hydrolase